jgi:hypothetical protein
VLLGSIGAWTVPATNAAETPSNVSETQKSPSRTSTSPGESPTHRPERRAVGDLKTGESTKAIKEKDKAKAAQSGNDATLRDLPSPAQKGSE